METESILYIDNIKPTVPPFVKDKFTERGMQFLELIRNGIAENQKKFLDGLCSKCKIEYKLQLENELKSMVKDQMGLSPILCKR